MQPQTGAILGVYIRLGASCQSLGLVEGGSQQTATALEYFTEEIEETLANRGYLRVDDTAAATSTDL